MLDNVLLQSRSPGVHAVFVGFDSVLKGAATANLEICCFGHLVLVWRRDAILH